MLSVNSRSKVYITDLDHSGFHTGPCYTQLRRQLLLSLAIYGFLFKSLFPVIKTSKWRHVLERKWQETITYHIRFFWDFGKLFAYLNDICQDEKKPANSLDSHWPGTSCGCSVDIENICEKIWAASGKEFTVSKKAPGTTASWKAWRSQETTLKRGKRKESCYVQLGMRTLGLHTEDE